MKQKMRALQSDKYFLGVGTKLKNDKPVVHVSQSALRFFLIVPLQNWMGSGCSGIIYLFLFKYWWRNVHLKMGAFFIRFVTFTSTLVYSFVWNQSIVIICWPMLYPTLMFPPGFLPLAKVQTISCVPPMSLHPTYAATRIGRDRFVHEEAEWS